MLFAAVLLSALPIPASAGNGYEIEYDFSWVRTVHTSAYTEYTWPDWTDTNGLSRSGGSFRTSHTITTTTVYTFGDGSTETDGPDEELVPASQSGDYPIPSLTASSVSISEVRHGSDTDTDSGSGTGEVRIPDVADPRTISDHSTEINAGVNGANSAAGGFETSAADGDRHEAEGEELEQGVVTRQEETALSSDAETRQSLSPVEGDPVRLATGELVHSQLDLFVRSIGPALELRRSYRSSNLYGGSFGQGWISSLDSRLVLSTRPVAADFRDELGAYLDAVIDERTGVAESHDQWHSILTASRDGAIARAASVVAQLEAVRASINQQLDRYEFNNEYESVLSRELSYVENRLRDARVREQRAQAALIELDQEYSRADAELRANEIVLQALLDEVSSDVEHGAARDRRNASAPFPLPSDQIEAGNKSLFLIDEEGTLRRYRYDAAPTRNALSTYAQDGSPNHYPAGSSLSPAEPDHDTRSFQVNPDGSYFRLGSDLFEYRYDFYGRLVSIRDPRGTNLLIEYGERGRAVRVSDSFGRSLVLTRDPSGRVVRASLATEDGELAAVSYEYNRDGYLAAAVDRAGRRIAYRYEGGRLTGIVKADGSYIRYGYDVEGRISSTADEETENHEGSEQFRYDPGNRRTEYIDQSGIRTVHHYDDRNRRVRTDYADGAHTLATYDAADRLTSLRDEAADRTQYDWTDGLLLRTRYPDGTSEHRSYNSQARLARIRDRDGFSTHLEYAEDGRLVAVRFPDGTSELYTHSATGLPTSFIDRSGARWNYAYNRWGYIERLEDPTGAVTRMETDPLGRVLSIRDADGVETAYAYNADGQVIEARRRLGEADGADLVARYSYDERGDLVAAVNPSGGVTSTVYDDRHLPLQITNPAGEVVQMSYTANGRLAGKAVYSAAGELAGHIEYEYDLERGRLVAETRHGPGLDRPLQSRYEYTPDGHVSAIINANESRTEYRYSSTGKLASVRFPAVPSASGSMVRHERSYSYTPSGRLELIVDEDGFEWRSNYDRRTRSLTEAFPDGSAAHFRFDPNGRLVSAIDGRGFETEYEYDDAGRLVSVRYPDGGQFSRSYTRAGRLAFEIRPNGEELTYVYDSGGRLKRIESNVRGATVLLYDVSGRLSELQLAAGGSERREYDSLGRLAASVNAWGGRTEYQYHPFGGVRSTSDSEGSTWSFAYDAAGRHIATVDPLGGRTTVFYDGMGRPISLVDAEGRSRGWSYDARGRVLSEYRGEDVRRSFRYDGRGNVLVEVDPSGARRRYAYDEVGRKIGESDRVGSQAQYAYDASGNRREKTDFNGNRTVYRYDEMNRIVRATYADGRENRYSYDAGGNLVSAVNAAADLRFRYASGGLMLEQEHVEVGETVSYRYDEVGRPSQTRILIHGRLEESISREYGPGDQLLALTTSAGTIELSYDDWGRQVSRRLPNGDRSEWSYDAAGRVSAVVHRAGSPWQAPYAAEISIYDRSGRRQFTVDERGAVTAYAYDSFGRLMEVEYPFESAWNTHNGGAEGAGAEPPGTGVRATPEYLQVSPTDRSRIQSAVERISSLSKSIVDTQQQIWPERFAYDERGNRVEAANQFQTIRADFDANDRLMRQDTVDFAHDANGNLIRATDASGRTDVYVYDQRNRLSSAVTQASDGRLSRLSYDYDALGRRVSRDLFTGGTSDGSVSPVLVDRARYSYRGTGMALLSEHAQRSSLAGSSASRLARSPSANPGRARIGSPETGSTQPVNRVDATRALAVTEHFALHLTVNGKAAARLGAGGSRFFCTDSLGNVIASVEAHRLADIPERFRYDAFGDHIGGEFAHPVPIAYNGKRLDPMTGMYDYGHRDYRPSLARFTTPDPIRDGANWYTYVNNDPVNFIDPWGLDSVYMNYNRARQELNVLYVETEGDVLTGVTHQASFYATNNVRSPEERAEPAVWTGGRSDQGAENPRYYPEPFPEGTFELTSHTETGHPEMGTVIRTNAVTTVPRIVEGQFDGEWHEDPSGDTVSGGGWNIHSGDRDVDAYTAGCIRVSEADARALKEMVDEVHRTGGTGSLTVTAGGSASTASEDLVSTQEKNR
jgi:RHS repeat-associated protein